MVTPESEYFELPLNPVEDKPRVNRWLRVQEYSQYSSQQWEGFRVSRIPQQGT